MYICVVRIMRTEIARRTDVNECHFVRRMPCFYMTRKRQRVIRSDLLCLFISCTVFIFSHFHLHGMQDNCPHTPTNTDQLLTNLILTCTLFEHPLPPCTCMSVCPILPIFVHNSVVSVLDLHHLP